ncbi:MAG: Zn-ribbon domain-containing OB-fold protein [Deltaproteobacteria bacterium]|nr:Zn-ribbon domain-containing OB-fold protein [Deltaproteobacteria bacterium]
MQIARAWRQQASNLRLVGSKCRGCGHLMFPERVRCSKCRGAELTSHGFAGRGLVSALTTVYEAPLGFADQVPYLAALVRLEEGPVVAAMLTDLDPGDAAVGMTVSMVTRRIIADGSDGPIVYGYKFTPDNGKAGREH